MIELIATTFSQLTTMFHFITHLARWVIPLTLYGERCLQRTLSFLIDQLSKVVSAETGVRLFSYLVYTLSVHFNFLKCFWITLPQCDDLKFTAHHFHGLTEKPFLWMYYAFQESLFDSEKQCGCKVFFDKSMTGQGICVFLCLCGFLSFGFFSKTVG